MSSVPSAILSTIPQSAGPTRGAKPGLMLPAMSLCRRELVRFLRQKHRIIGALATPIVFWLLIGGGMGRSFRGPGVTDAGGNYLQFFFPGTILMILLFTAIFSTISIIEDRKEGFLQSVLVAPVSRMSIVLGKVLGGTVLAFGQAFLFLLLAPTVGIRPTPVGFVLAMAMMLVVGFSLTTLGFCIAWKMTSTQGFHAIMNLFLMPLWFLSGALFPPSGAMGGIGWVMRANPLTYGLDGMRQALTWGSHSTGSHTMASLPICFAVSVGFAAVLFAAASVIASSRSSGEFE